MMEDIVTWYRYTIKKNGSEWDGWTSLTKEKFKESLSKGWEIIKWEIGKYE